MHNVVLALLGLDKLRWNPWAVLTGHRALYERAQEALGRSAWPTAPNGSSPKRPMANGGGWSSPWRWRRNPRCCCSTNRWPASHRASAGPSAICSAIPRDVTIVMIEHDMDTALGFAERITLLHYGEVIVEGTRAEVVADPRTREVYLGD